MIGFEAITSPAKLVSAPILADADTARKICIHFGFCVRFM
jgi:hypothetical protein